MTVGFSSVSSIKAGRVEEAIAAGEKFKKVLTAAGAQNVRTMILMGSTPIRTVVSYEAADQAALGKVSDTFMADPAAIDLMREMGAKDGWSAGYTTDTWIEV